MSNLKDQIEQLRKLQIDEVYIPYEIRIGKRARYLIWGHEYRRGIIGRGPFGPRLTALVREAERRKSENRCNLVWGPTRKTRRGMVVASIGT